MSLAAAGMQKFALAIANGSLAGERVKLLPQPNDRDCAARKMTSVQGRGLLFFSGSIVLLKASHPGWNSINQDKPHQAVASWARGWGMQPTSSMACKQHSGSSSPSLAFCSFSVGLYRS